MNPFTALCKLASEEKWCWKIVCTTCGHQLFRYSFLELSRDKHPDSNDWLVSFKNQSSLSSILGPTPRFQGFTIQQQEILTGIFADSSIFEVSKITTYPDWLGYIGLALYYTEDFERKERVLTPIWARQFSELIPKHLASNSFLDAILSNQGMILEWRDMTPVEQLLEMSFFNRSY